MTARGTADGFRDQLRALGLGEGDVVLMHSSMKSLGTDKTPDAFLDDILCVIGPEGTLLVPALTYANVTTQQPRFSLRDTEPCIGLLPRTFFRREGVIRSLHPTHSVCGIGKHAQELLSQHELDETPVGPHSPFMRLLEKNGKLLFIGEVLHACTFMHGIEEIVHTPYTLKEERNHYILEDGEGNVTERHMFRHNFNGWRQEYQRIRDILEYPDIRTGHVGDATCYLIDANRLKERALEKFREDILYFVTDLRS